MSRSINRALMLGTRILVPLLILAAGFGVFQALVATAPEVRRTDQGMAAPKAPVFVVRATPVQRQWHGYGTAEAKRVADVPARVTATVLERSDEIEPGMAVEAGQLLVQLDDSDYRRQAEVARQTLADLEAQLKLWEVEHAGLKKRVEVEAQDAELARDELERVRAFVEQGGGSQQDVDRAERTFYAAERTRLQMAEELDRMGPRRLQLEAQIEGQRSTLRRAETDVERCAIRSPIAGVLQAVDVEVGENVAVGERVARVVDVSLIDVPIRLPSSARATVHVGDVAQVELMGRRGEACEAVVTRIAPEDDPATRTMTVYVTVDQGRVENLGPLSPGAFVSATVVSDVVESRWVVPRRSIRGGRLFAVVNGIVQSRPAQVDFALRGAFPETGLPDVEWAVLAEEASMAEGDLVLVNASQSVMDGQMVEAIVQGPGTPSGEAAAMESTPREATP